MTLPKITTTLPYEDFAVETDRTWVDWIHEADDPKKNHLKPEALDDILVLDVSEANIGGLFCSSILAEFGADVIRIEPPEREIVIHPSKVDLPAAQEYFAIGLNEDGLDFCSWRQQISLPLALSIEQNQSRNTIIKPTTDHDIPVGLHSHIRDRRIPLLVVRDQLRIKPEGLVN